MSESFSSSDSSDPSLHSSFNSISSRDLSNQSFSESKLSVPPSSSSPSASLAPLNSSLSFSSTLSSSFHPVHNYLNSVERSIVEKDAAIYERNSRIRELSVQYSKQAQQIEQMMKQFQINKIQQNYQKSNQFKHSQTKQTNIEIQAYKEPAPAPATLTIQTIIPTIPTIAAHLPSVTAEHSPNSHSSSPRIPQPQTSLFSQADSMLDNRNQLNDIHVKSVQLLQKELQQNRSTIAELEHSLRSHQQNELKTSEYETNNHQPSQINHPQVQPIEQPTYPRPSTPSATIGDKSNSIDNPTNIDRIEAPHAVHTNNSSSNNQNLIFQEKANSQAAETSHQEQQLTQMKQKQFFLEQSIQSILEHINNPHQQTNKFSSNPLELAGNSLPHDQALQQNQPNESKSADSQSPSQSSHHPSPQHHHHNDDDHSHNIKCDHCHRHSKHRKKKPHRKHKGEKCDVHNCSSLSVDPSSTADSSIVDSSQLDCDRSSFSSSSQSSNSHHRSSHHHQYSDSILDQLYRARQKQLLMRNKLHSAHADSCGRSMEAEHNENVRKQYNSFIASGKHSIYNAFPTLFDSRMEYCEYREMRTSLLLIANERDQLKHKIEEMEKSQRRIALKKSMRTQQMQQLKSKLELLQQQNVVLTHELNLVRTDADRKVENEQKCLNELIRIQHANNELQKQLKKLKKEERKERKGKEKLLSQRVDDENKDERKQLKGYEKKIEELTLQLNKKEQDLYFALKAAGQLEKQINILESQTAINLDHSDSTHRTHKSFNSNISCSAPTNQSNSQESGSHYRSSSQTSVWPESIKPKSSFDNICSPSVAIIHDYVDRGSPASSSSLAMADGKRSKSKSRLSSRASTKRSKSKSSLSK